MGIEGSIGPINEIRPALRESPSGRSEELLSATGLRIYMRCDGPHSRIVRSSGLMIAIHSHQPMPSPDNDLADLAMRLLGDPETSSGRMDQVSMAIWSDDDQSLHLYRSRLGVPPMFYQDQASGFLWSTSLRGILDLGASREVDPLAMAQYQLIGYVQSPRTFFESISKIPPAHRLEVRGEGRHLQRYWSPQWKQTSQSSGGARQAALEDAMATSIDRLLPASGSTGVLLSGGIDSVGIATIATRVVGADVEAFTMTYPGKTRHDESHAARAVADSLGIPHHEIELTPEYVESSLESLIETYEEPFSYGLHSARLDPVTAEGISVFFTGAEGASWELNRALRVGVAAGAYLPRAVSSATQRLVHALPSWAHDLATVLDMASSSGARRFLADRQHVLIAEEHARQLNVDETLTKRARDGLEVALSSSLEGFESMSPENRLAMLGLSSFGAEHLLWWTYRWGEQAGAIPRFPLLDNDYVDWMARRARRHRSKTDRREVVAKYLPRELAYKKKKPQSLPLGEWLRKELLSTARSVLSPDALEADPILSRSTVGECLRAHSSGESDHKWCLWTSMSYLIWRDVWDAR